MYEFMDVLWNVDVMKTEEKENIYVSVIRGSE